MLARSRTERPRLDRQRMAQISRVALVVSAAALTFALGRLQIVASDQYALIAKENRVRPIVVPAPRGTIYDRHGQVVAENVVGYQVLLMPAPMDSMLAQLARLKPVLGLTDREVALALSRYRREPHLPMVVTANASPGGVARLQERRFMFPGVLVFQYPRRHYPAGEAVAHLVGYVAEISKAELELPEFRGYRQGRWIGKAGLERYHERLVGGEPGVRYLEVDALGRIKRWLPEESGLPPVPGRDLTLYLDLDLQRYVAEIFPKGMRGAFVALDPATGGVLALYSSPSFDPNLFVGGIDPEIWQRLNSDPGKPLLDRATGSSQPPGSTFKLVTTAMAMDLGLLDPHEVMPIPCTGGMRYQRRYARCWYGRGHGYKDLIGAIKNSCNVYFYQVGIRIGLERFLELGSRIGIAGPTGIDLPSEIGSTFPGSTDDWQRRFGYRPYDNEIMSLAIGQGMVTLSPLRLAQLYVAVARPDGRAPVPRLAQLEDPPPIGLDLHLSPEGIAAIRRGLRRVLGPGGTAHLSRLPFWDFMGKTGTAQNPHGPDHAWFVGIGGRPGHDPEIVAVMLLEHGEHGYTASGYVANAVNFFLSRKYGMPFERYPTPRERLKHDLPVDWGWLSSEVQDGAESEP
jgi:penicillin-binding protein 2